MFMNLSDDESRAVDFLLNKVYPDAHVANTFVAPDQMVMPQVIQSVQRVLAILKHYPPVEPSADLLARTLKHCDQASVSSSATVQAPQTGQQPTP